MEFILRRLQKFLSKSILQQMTLTYSMKSSGTRILCWITYWSQIFLRLVLRSVRYINHLYTSVFTRNIKDFSTKCCHQSTLCKAPIIAADLVLFIILVEMQDQQNSRIKMIRMVKPNCLCIGEIIFYVRMLKI